MSGKIPFKLTLKLNGDVFFKFLTPFQLEFLNKKFRAKKG